MKERKRVLDSKRKTTNLRLQSNEHRTTLPTYICMKIGNKKKTKKKMKEDREETKKIKLKKQIFKKKKNEKWRKLRRRK